MSPLASILHHRTAPTLSLLTLALGFTGCAHTYNVKVDALHNPNVTSGTSYRIVPHDDVKADFDPAYAEAVQLVESALATRGYFPAATPRDAEMVVEIDLGIGSKRRRAIEDPAFFGMPHLPSANAAKSRPDLAQNLAAGPNQPFSAEPPPITRVSVITVYQKYLTLSARETERATLGLRKPAELWRVNVAIEDAKEDITSCLPVLIVTAIDKIGTSTGERESIRVSDRTPALLATNADP